MTIIEQALALDCPFGHKAGKDCGGRSDGATFMCIARLELVTGPRPFHYTDKANGHDETKQLQAKLELAEWQRDRAVENWHDTKPWLEAITILAQDVPMPRQDGRCTLGGCIAWNYRFGQTRPLCRVCKQ